MGNIVQMNKYAPITEDDFYNLNKYKIEKLFELIKSRNEYTDQIIDHLFFRLMEEERIEEFKSVLRQIDLYDEFVNDIKSSKNDKYKQHLVLYYENDLIDELYGGEFLLAKKIYSNRNKFGPNDYCYDHLLKLASIAEEPTTLLIIKNRLIKLVKENTRRSCISNLCLLMIQGKTETEKHMLYLKHLQGYLIDEFTTEADKVYQLNQKNKNI